MGRRMGSVHPLSLIVVLGSAGSGKTTFARQLVPEFGCVYLDSDTISEAAFPGDREFARVSEGETDHLPHAL